MRKRGRKLFPKAAGKSRFQNESKWGNANDFDIEKFLQIAYNTFNKEADTIAYTYPFPAKDW